MLGSGTTTSEISNDEMNDIAKIVMLLEASALLIKVVSKTIMLPNSLTSFEIQKYYQNDHKHNGVYSRNSLPKLKDVTYAINID